jgi:hypothetical protein
MTDPNPYREAARLALDKTCYTEEAGFEETINDVAYFAQMVAEVTRELKGLRLHERIAAALVRKLK